MATPPPNVIAHNIIVDIVGMRAISLITSTLVLSIAFVATIVVIGVASSGNGSGATVPLNQVAKARSAPNLSSNLRLGSSSDK